MAPEVDQIIKAILFGQLNSLHVHGFSHGKFLQCREGYLMSSSTSGVTVGGCVWSIGETSRALCAHAIKAACRE